MASVEYVYNTMMIMMTFNDVRGRRRRLPAEKPANDTRVFIVLLYIVEDKKKKHKS